MKPIYTFDDMITYLDDKKISYHSKEKTINTLENYNFFYKLMSYRKNFNKRNDGTYINLNFETLSDLATLDMHLRYLLLKMCLDIEHKLKTVLLAEITNDPNQDGYTIIDHFIAVQKDPSKAKKSLLGYAKYSYNKPLYEKYKERPPIWVVFETMSFGTLVNFVDFYVKNYPNTNFPYLEKNLVYVKNIRNTAAHNTSLLNGITEKEEFNSPSVFVTSNVYSKEKIGLTTARKKLKNKRIHDITVLFLVYDLLISEGSMKKFRKKELFNFFIRARRKSDLYQKHNSITSAFTYFYNLVTSP